MNGTLVCVRPRVLLVLADHEARQQIAKAMHPVGGRRITVVQLPVRGADQ